MSSTPPEIPSKQVLQSSLSGDLNKLVSLFAENAVVMPPNDTTLFGKDEIQTWWEDYFRHFRIASSVEIEREVTVGEHQLFERGSASVVIVPRARGPRIRDDIRDLVVWKRDASGTWKISHMIWNSIKPVGSGTNRYMTRMLQKKSGS